MAHKMVAGIDRMVATTLQTVWHRAETVESGILKQITHRGDTEQTMLDGAAIVWPQDADNDIDRVVGLTTDEGVQLDSHMATVSRTGRVLGVVGAGYTPVPFKVILRDWLLALARAGGVLETLGTFDSGANFFASLLVADGWRVPGDSSETRPLFNVVANHAGDGGIRGSFATFRVVCANTSAMYTAQHDRVTDAKERAARAWVSVQHRGDAAERIQDAVEWIVDGRARVESEKALLARLACKVISQSEVARFVDRYINIPDDSSGRQTTIRTGARDDFQAVMRNASDLGNHAMTSNGITAYGLLQAVTHFEDWTARVVSPDAPVATRRAFRAFLGERETEKATARDAIVAMAS